jgi:hypothetical protein
MFNKKNIYNSEDYFICPLVHSYYMLKDISGSIPELKTFCETEINNKHFIDNKKSLLGEIKLGSQISINHINNTLINNLKKSIIDMAKAYIYSYIYKTKNSSFGIDSIWIVNQLATDYNPIHIHENSKSDYGLSGFIHINLPNVLNKKKNLENLCNIHSRGSKGCHDGVTSLIWRNQGGSIAKKSFIHPGIIECPLDTGIIYLFPSWLDHTVYPFFNSDESRITIAFNVWVLWE